MSLFWCCSDLSSGLVLTAYKRLRQLARHLFCNVLCRTLCQKYIVNTPRSCNGVFQSCGPKVESRLEMNSHICSSAPAGTGADISVTRKVCCEEMLYSVGITGKEVLCDPPSLRACAHTHTHTHTLFTVYTPVSCFPPNGITLSCSAAESPWPWSRTHVWTRHLGESVWGGCVGG